ncbi:MAG: imidazoleglycerol-phosphate dehydratase HisB [Burkholderiales bacterium]|nr:imidazoleglycerol-phosphate dehydratase HisB [Burkholderiales bacterium]
MRQAKVTRSTKETSIEVAIDLDGSGICEVNTGIGFFDHMLEQISKHGLIDLFVMCDGDLYVDGHHSIEDVGIAFGECLAKALGDKKGIVRFGFSMVPLDEALSRTVIDLSGRSYLVWNVEFTSPTIGQMDSQLPREFFLAVASNAKMTLHMANLEGVNAHHQCESLFKSFGRALRQAVEIDPRKSDAIPSTKGVL